MAKDRRKILFPYIPEEAMLLGEAVQRTGWSDATLRDRAVRFGLARKIGGRWIFSRVALELFLNGQTEGLAAYHEGNRTNPEVIEAFARLGLPIEPPPPSTRQRQRARRGGGAHATA